MIDKQKAIPHDAVASAERNMAISRPVSLYVKDSVGQVIVQFIDFFQLVGNNSLSPEGTLQIMLLTVSFQEIMKLKLKRPASFANKAKV